MEGQALKNHCSAAAGFLPKSGGSGGRRSFSSSCWTPPRFLRHPKRNGGRISVVERTPPLRSLPPLSLQQQQQEEEFVEGNDVEEEEEDASNKILHEMTTMSTGGGINKSRSTTTTTTVHVKFVLQRECSFGERFLLVGDDPMFGLWDLQNAIPLNWSEGHFWTAEMDLPLEKCTIQYKFILGDPSGEFHWQPGPDRVLQIWETPNTIVVTEDWDKAENQKITEEEEEQSIISSNGGDDAAVQLLVSCGLASIDPPPPVNSDIPNDEAKLMAVTDQFPNDDVVENEKPLDILFTSEI